MEMAADPLVGAWAGTVVAAHIGSMFSFNIPVSLGVIAKADHHLFSIGALSGLIACPFGCILGGLLAGLSLPVILSNMVPALIVSLIVILGLILIPEIFIRGFVMFGRSLRSSSLNGLALAVSSV
jgi:ethanolamine transporter